MMGVFLSSKSLLLVMALLLSAAVLFLPTAGPARAQTADTPTPVPTVMPTPVQSDDSAIRDLLAREGKIDSPKYPNTDSNLNRIVQEAELGGFTAQAMTAAASSAPINREQSVAVTLHIEEGYADAIAAYLLS